MELQHLLADPSAAPILRERAQSLARAEDAADAAESAMHLSFCLGGTTYTLPAAAVSEVVPLGHLTALPAVPAFVAGLVNVRGRLLAAIDIRPLLDLQASAPAPGAQLLIVAADAAEVALLTDTVIAVRSCSPRLSPAPMSVPGHALPWVLGVDEELSVHLVPELLLADPALLVRAEAEG